MAEELAYYNTQLGNIKYLLREYARSLEMTPSLHSNLVLSEKIVQARITELQEADNAGD